MSLFLLYKDNSPPCPYSSEDNYLDCTKTLVGNDFFLKFYLYHFLKS